MVKLFKTPTANLGVRSNPQHPDKRKAGGHGPNLGDEVCFLLPTPKASDGPHGGPNQRNSRGVYDALPGMVVNLLPTPTGSDGTGGPGVSLSRKGGMNLRTAVVMTQDWAEYEPAIRRQEALIGRPAPVATEIGPRGGRRLSAHFTEWMMCVPEGWVTDVPGLTRNQQIERLGNGVVPLQAEAAFRFLMADWPEKIAGQLVGPAPIDLGRGRSTSYERNTMAERKCSVCQQPGHTKRTCVQVSGESVHANGDVTKGPWFGAQFPGICEKCSRGFEEGDQIRSDGSGGWECESWCGQDDQVPLARDRHWERPTAVNVQLPPRPHCVKGRCNGCCGCSSECTNTPCGTPRDAANVKWDPNPTKQDLINVPMPAKEEVDAFLSPSVVVEAPADETTAKTERLGYICKDPVIGDFRRYQKGHKQGITRTTTFVKAASDSYGIAQWNKRNVLLGAARRPDIAARAHGMDVNQDRAQLDRWVEELEDAAGGNVASSMGTEVHCWTERVDSGECTVDDVPPTYRTQVRLYVDALKDAGFRVVNELRERTTFIEEFGGVAGTFDAILHHVPSDSYVLSDTKSGKNVGKYGWTEIETQEWVYAHGYNRFGTYNWETHEWEPPRVQVRMDYGLVIHIPFEGDYAGTCRLLRTDLREGEAHARLCHDVRSGAKGKAVPWSLPSPGRDWDLEFSSVTDMHRAGELWKQARAAAVPPMELQRLVGLAQDALRKLP